MKRPATGRDLSRAIFDVLEAWGLPKHVTSLNISIASADAPIEITCTFNPTAPDGSLKILEEQFVSETQRFHLTPIEETEAV